MNLLYPPLSVCLCSTYMVTEYMGIRNESFMKMAAVGTWMGDFVTAWMVRWFSTFPLWLMLNIIFNKKKNKIFSVLDFSALV